MNSLKWCCLSQHRPQDNENKNKPSGCLTYKEMSEADLRSGGHADLSFLLWVSSSTFEEGPKHFRNAGDYHQVLNVTKGSEQKDFPLPYFLPCRHQHAPDRNVLWNTRSHVTCVCVWCQCQRMEKKTFNMKLEWVQYRPISVTLPSVFSEASLLDEWSWNTYR